jgi:hypothetical protein
MERGGGERTNVKNERKSKERKRRQEKWGTVSERIWLMKNEKLKNESMNEKWKKEKWFD